MPRPSKWTFLTNHAMVLREIAGRVGITERAVHRILADLSVNGYVLRRRVGRRTQYSVNPGRPFRHPLVKQLEVARLLEALDPRRRG